ncbi:MAG: PAS domain-containing protein [Opitutaceae bacterium]|nr:PAS domain-containing protein [Opitutaceae bacterium]
MSDEATLLLTANGTIQYASATVSQWWQVDPGALHGDSFSNLFVFEVVSSDPEWRETQWSALLDTGSIANGVTLTAQPKLSPPFDVTVTIEPIVGAQPPLYFAHVRKATAADRSGSAPGAVYAPSALSGPAARFTPLIERSQLGFFDLDFAQRQFYFSPAWKNLLGFLDKDLPNLETTWRDLVHPDDSAAAPDCTDRKFPNQTRPFSTEFRMRTKGGGYEWVLANGVQIFGEDSSLQRVLGAMSSIQERKEFEESCIASEERLESLGRAGELAAFDLDFGASSFWFSSGLRRLAGYRDADLPAGPESFAHLLPTDQVPRGAHAWLGEKSPGVAVLRDTFELTHKDGHPILVHGVFVRTFDRRKALLRAIGYFIPGATAGAPGRMPPILLRSSYDAVSEGVLVADREGRIVFLNARAARLLGTAAERAEGRPAAEVVRLVHRLNQIPVESPITRVLDHGELIELNDEHSLPDTNGLRRIVFACSPAKDAEGKVQGAVFVFRDPEEMSLTPDELIRSNRFETLGLLAGGIAHDFNNLLTTILGGISIAREAKDNSQLEDSEKGCIAAKALTRQLLALARGGADLRQILNPADILQESVRLAAVGTPVKVELQISEDLHMIHADKAEIIRVFQNLIINAIQAMPNGSGHIWVRAYNSSLNEGDVPPLAAGDYVHFEVQDNGSGIPAEHLQKIFEPFFTTKKTGTGLGLATVISIVKTHGGQVGVTSSSAGTTFSIFLPRADQPVAEIQREAPTLRFGTGRILVMDDEEKILHLTGIMLENLGYKFDVARNGKDAIALYQRYLNVSRPYDCVLLDLTIVGGMGGEETYRELKKLNPDLRAIISSGYDSEEMMRRYLDMGFYGYLSKPFRVGELGKILKKVLGGGAAS